MENNNAMLTPCGDARAYTQKQMVKRMQIGHTKGFQFTFPGTFSLRTCNAIWFRERSPNLLKIVCYLSQTREGSEIRGAALSHRCKNMLRQNAVAGFY